MSETTGPQQPDEASPAGGPPRQLRPTDVKRLNRSWRRATGARVALLLDSVTQPFNVGMIVRSAAAFGAEHIWLCGNSATLDHPSAAKTALGTQRLLSWEREPDPVAAAKAARADGSGKSPIGMFNPSAKVSILRARPSAWKSERILTVSRGLVPATAG